MVDTLAAEYGQHPGVIRKIPLAEALCYHAAILERHEVDAGVPTFSERDAIRNLKL